MFTLLWYILLCTRSSAAVPLKESSARSFPFISPPPTIDAVDQFSEANKQKFERDDQSQYFDQQPVQSQEQQQRFELPLSTLDQGYSQQYSGLENFLHSSPAAQQSAPSPPESPVSSSQVTSSYHDRTPDEYLTSQSSVPRPSEEVPIPSANAFTSNVYTQPSFNEQNSQSQCEAGLAVGTSEPCSNQEASFLSKYDNVEFVPVAAPTSSADESRQYLPPAGPTVDHSGGSTSSSGSTSGSSGFSDSSGQTDRGSPRSDAGRLQTVLVGDRAVVIPQFTDSALTADGSEVFVTDGARIVGVDTLTTSSFSAAGADAVQTVVLRGGLYPTGRFSYISDPTRTPIVASTKGCVTKIDVTGGNVEGSGPPFVPSPVLIDLAQSLQQLCNQEIAFRQESNFFQQPFSGGVAGFDTVSVGGSSSSQFPPHFHQFSTPGSAALYTAPQPTDQTASFPQPSDSYNVFPQQQHRPQRPLPQPQHGPSPVDRGQSAYDGILELAPLRPSEPPTTSPQLEPAHVSFPSEQPVVSAEFHGQQSRPIFTGHQSSAQLNGFDRDRYHPDFTGSFSSQAGFDRDPISTTDPSGNRFPSSSQAFTPNSHSFGTGFPQNLPSNNINSATFTGSTDFDQTQQHRLERPFSASLPATETHHSQGHSGFKRHPPAPHFIPQHAHHHFPSGPLLPHHPRPLHFKPTLHSHTGGGHNGAHPVSCGVRNKQLQRLHAGLFGGEDSSSSSSRSGRISSGFTQSSSAAARYAAHPWHVAILAHDHQYRGEGTVLPGGGEYVCGGSLVSANMVLTAAHCVTDIRREHLAVRLGDHDLRTDLHELHSPIELKVARVFIHPDYAPSQYRSDLALLQLVRAIPLSRLPHIGLICLPNGRATTLPCHVAGWGRDAYQSDQYGRLPLKSVAVTPISSGVCTDRLRSTPLGPNFVLNNSSLCAVGEHGQDACLGDGGGGLVCPSSTAGGPEGDKSQFVLVGVTSWGIRCDAGFPGVYTDVAAHITWLRSVLGVSESSHHSSASHELPSRYF